MSQRPKLLKLNHENPMPDLTVNEKNVIPMPSTRLVSNINCLEDLNADEQDEIIMIKGEGNNLFDDTFMNIHISFI
jgi:hypothetical protein